MNIEPEWTVESMVTKMAVCYLGHVAKKALEHDWHILHDTTKNEVPPCRLKSRQPYNREAQEMLCVIPKDRSKDAWIAAAWKPEREASGPTRVHGHVLDSGESVKREYLSRKHWKILNRTGVGSYRSSMRKWGQTDSAAYRKEEKGGMEDGMKYG